MNYQANSRHLHRVSSNSRPSRIFSRQFSGVSSAERGSSEPNHEIIDERARYEDFMTIDWIQDAARERLLKSSRYFNATRGGLWRRKLRASYSAAQSWIVITIIGAAIGLNASFLNIVTEWLSDIKLGYCSTAFYLNEKFCCWGTEIGCQEWHKWSGILPLNYLMYILFSTLFAYSSAQLVQSFAPYAAGSGISEIKCIIAGFVMKGFLGVWTLVIKSIGLPLSIASGLSVGKEGPSVHYAVCTGNVISRLFEKYRNNAAKTREILSASAAAGVGVAFGSPIGGVIFSLEEMSNYFPLKTMWRSYFCALVAAAVISAINPFRTGQLVMFQVQYEQSWHFFELFFCIIIGIFGGLYGAFVIKWNLRVQAFRKNYLSKYAILEATLLATFTAIICYPNKFLRIDMTESLELLFLDCEGGRGYDYLCKKNNRFYPIFSLAFATMMRTILVIVSYGCKVPAGIFVPSMAIGATFGRIVGEFVQIVHEAMPHSPLFATCEPDISCINPGMYAFLGAGAALSGVMHITVSVVVILFELTGALTYILPMMIVVGVTKFVSERFGKGGIADRTIWFNGFPFLDNKEDHTFDVSVSRVMVTNLTVLPASGIKLQEVESVLDKNTYQGYPLVEDRNSKALVGYIGRTELRHAIDRAKRERDDSSNLTFVFGPDTSGPSNSVINDPATSFDTIAVTSSQMKYDLSRYIDPTPLTLHPRLPLETVMEVFKKLGPRVIFLEDRGRLTGLVTVKDCLKYQVKTEMRGHVRDNMKMQKHQEQLWKLISGVGSWVLHNILRMNESFTGIFDGPNDSASLLQGSRGTSRQRLENPVTGRSDVELESR